MFPKNLFFVDKIFEYNKQWVHPKYTLAVADVKSKKEVGVESVNQGRGQEKSARKKEVGVGSAQKSAQKKEVGSVNQERNQEKSAPRKNRKHRERSGLEKRVTLVEGL